ncbi:drug/metabolite transporter (DMT)-like permease [Bacillus thermophilus]|uniref:Drug/metabolite transporter (DMT)-like permease n=1 Tax=Siminovitchia thermophila TaxID=1245522 RepID=A0ABS2RCR7_9BACI|nr:DMT family transporter [Siminovitchia thermophila]MBM7716964.1 drug/metabolite transporter (DMT)-like permease [Siminovitchia thermophila]ONK25288.1 EamA family transporter [Bacillus sp. VT-16-64]
MNSFLLYILLFVLMIVWGFNVTAIKIIVSHFSPVTITSLRIFLAFLTLSPLLFYRNKIQRLSFKNILMIACVAVFGVLGHHAFLSVGLKYTSAANGGLILGSVPIVTTVAAALFLGDRLTVFRILGLVFGFSGVALIMLAKPGAALQFSIGDIFIFLAVLTQAASFILINKMANSVGSQSLTGLSMLMGSVMLFVLSVTVEPEGLASLKTGTLMAWLVFFASGSIATAMGHLLYNYAIQRIGAGQAALFLNLSPFFSLVGAAVFLGEKIYSIQWIGFLLIVVGVVLGTGFLEHRAKIKKPEGGK